MTSSTHYLPVCLSFCKYLCPYAFFMLPLARQAPIAAPEYFFYCIHVHLTQFIFESLILLFKYTHINIIYFFLELISVYLIRCIFKSYFIMYTYKNEINFYFFYTRFVSFFNFNSYTYVSVCIWCICVLYIYTLILH